MSDATASDATETSTSRRWGLRASMIVIIPFACWMTAMIAMSFFSQPPQGLGVRDGRLAPCGESPNCVSTQCKDSAKKMEPIEWSGTPQAAMTRLVEVIEAMPRTVIVEQQGQYLHAEFTSSLFRFVDDVEFYVDPAEKVIHFRSASRSGYSDIGVNRKTNERNCRAIHEGGLSLSFPSCAKKDASKYSPARARQKQR